MPCLERETHSQRVTIVSSRCIQSLHCSRTLHPCQLLFIDWSDAASGQGQGRGRAPSRRLQHQNSEIFDDLTDEDDDDRASSSHDSEVTSSAQTTPTPEARHERVPVTSASNAVSHNQLQRNIFCHFLVFVVLFFILPSLQTLITSSNLSNQLFSLDFCTQNSQNL